MSVAVALWIDDADYIDDRSEEALEYLLSMLDRLGIRATFKLAGEKIRTLERHGRNDLIKALCRHDLCYHSDFHSLHPTVTEYTESLSFHDGAAEFEKREMQGFRDLQRITGREVVGFGQPGESWSPDVFPILRKNQALVNLDDHFILDVDGMAFSYGGVLNFNHIRRIRRYDYHDEAGLKSAEDEFDRLAETDFGRDYPETVRLFSVFYHPSEFFSAEYLGDYYNFRGGKNLAYDDEGNFRGYIMPPGLDRDTEHEYMERVGRYLSHMLEYGAHFVTANDLTGMQIRRGRRIDLSDVRELADSFSRGEISFHDIGGEYVSPSEAFALISEALSGKPLSTFLIYGPERREVSCIDASAVITSEQAANAMKDFDMICGYPQLKSLYAFEKARLAPADLCATAAYMLANDLDSCHPVHGTLKCEECVQYHSDWSNRWLFGDDFHVPNTYEKTKLQCWTLKPVRY